MSTEIRRYELRQRAERQRETRQRIVEATAALHEEIGPANTTVAEIARRAGVQRLTVYNHFPEQGDLFAACQAHFLTEHPLPSFDDALALENPPERVRAALRALYASYRERQPMTTKVLRDRANLPALDALMTATMDASQAALRDGLAAGFGARGQRAGRLKAALGLALDFWTWERLSREGLDDEAAAELMTDLAAGVARGRA